VASNLFGDIITDLGAMLQGGMGFAAGGNINPEKKFPSMFEPIHGSAPKYSGKGVVNPVASIESIAMMLEHLGQEEAAGDIRRAVSEVLGSGAVKTGDMGGRHSTSKMSDAIRDRLLKS
jgi:isocitrate/isopropylmalate dehydrogenase